MIQEVNGYGLESSHIYAPFNQSNKTPDKIC